MTDALYGPDGFYRQASGPAAHFRTSVHATPLFGQALLRLAAAVFDDLGQPGGFTFVDVGAGRGELLSQLSPLAPDDWRLVGVEVVPRPAGLPDRVEWVADLQALPQLAHAFLVANEWLDNVPVDVLVDGRLLEVDRAGRERPGPAPSERDRAWCDAFAAFPDDPGERTEIGWPRDEAWAALADKVERGLALAIDYAIDEFTPAGGTLTGYRNGQQVAPVPDGSCDLTAHVHLEAVGHRRPCYRTTQQAALSELGLSAVVPPRELASSDPPAYLRQLSLASEAREILDPAGLGRFGWLVEPHGLARPERFQLGPLG